MQVFSAFVGGTSQQLRGSEPDSNTNDKAISKADFPVADYRPVSPTPNEFYFDKNKSPMTPVWFDASTNKWRDYANSICTSPDKLFLSFGFTKAANPSLASDIVGVVSASSVAITVPSGTDPDGLKASFSLTALASAKVGLTAQVSGVTANDFSSPVTYTITAEDTTTKTYTVTVTVAS